MGLVAYARLSIRRYGTHGIQRSVKKTSTNVSATPNNPKISGKNAKLLNRTETLNISKESFLLSWLKEKTGNNTFPTEETRSFERRCGKRLPWLKKARSADEYTLPITRLRTFSFRVSIAVAKNTLAPYFHILRKVGKHQ